MRFTITNIERKTGEVTDAFWARLMLEDGTRALAFFEMKRGSFLLLHCEHLPQDERDAIRDLMMDVFLDLMHAETMSAMDAPQLVDDADWEVIAHVLRG